MGSSTHDEAPRRFTRSFNGPSGPCQGRTVTARSASPPAMFDSRKLIAKFLGILMRLRKFITIWTENTVYPTENAA
ncbi:hypothetical protein IE4803_CH03314 [Rhizobium etli bv. phaseoli str. IE4803]|nr:hypothetical protein IE4803_CH03314 [Rhizobium etli bv. phaseoli str. IE4803]